MVIDRLRRHIDRLRRSTTARFIGLHLLASLITTGAALAVVWGAVDRLLVNEVRQLVQADARALVAAHANGGARAVRAEIMERATDGHRIFRLDDAVERLRVGDLGRWPSGLAVGRAWVMLPLPVGPGDRLRLYGVATVMLPDGGRLLVGHDLDDLARLRGELGLAMALAALFALPLALGLSLIVTRLMNRRVAAIAGVAARVAAGDLSHRVVTRGSHDPFDRLGASFNAMLARIDLLMGELRTLADGLAHDLRSPLGRIRARAERLLARTEDERDQQLLVDLIGETEAILKLLNATLEVSRAEAGVGRDRFEPVDLAALLSGLADIYAPVAEDGDMLLSLALPDMPLVVAGSQPLLAQAVANLIENALHYASDGGVIILSATATVDAVRLCVADRGPGIPPDRQAEARRKFGRLDPARSDTGTGLGLALVAAVARLHGGTLDLGDNSPGLVATLNLPRNRHDDIPAI